MGNLMVPAEPTEEMVLAGLMALVAEISKVKLNGLTIVEGVSPEDHRKIAKLMETNAIMRSGSEVIAVYKAMLEAARLPAPLVETGG